ncbi:MAG: hypothetical protein KDD44_15465, partial [Bdellovibrionales bacterium]|nr:hypothetical protein [Bdellovibrionales bacterium]
LSGQSPLYDLPFFYPFKNTLTYSDPFLSSGLMALVVRQLWSGASLIAQVNLQLIAGTILYLLSLYWLIRTLGGRGAAAILLSVIGTFVPLRFVYVVHVHTYLIFAIPLSIACFIHYNQSGQKRFLLGFAAAYLFQMANAPMTAYFFMITIALYALFQRQWWGTLIRDRWQQLVFAGLLFLSVALYLPYWSQAASEQSFRTIRDAAHFSYSIERLGGWDVVALVSFTIVLFVTMRKSKKTLRQLLPWWCIALVGLVAMLGPVVKVDEQTLR